MLALRIGLALTAAAAISPVQAGPQASLTVDGTEYGASAKLSGVYFTNFENSVFTECAGEDACRNWVSKGGAWVNCTPAACRDLDARIKALNGNSDNWGSFAITFVGRHAKAKHAKRFLNDREDEVLIEQIVAFRLIKGQD